MNETETYWLRMADTIACRCVACAWAVDTDEADQKRKRKLTGCRLWT